jgi:hypothetical protein
VPKGKKKPSQNIVKLPIRWNYPNSVVTRFASNMIVQNLENAFKISFFEAVPEIRLNPSEGTPTEVRADCVASVIITTDKLPGFINALQKHLDRYNDMKKRAEEKP